MLLCQTSTIKPIILHLFHSPSVSLSPFLSVHRTNKNHVQVQPLINAYQCIRGDSLLINPLAMHLHLCCTNFLSKLFGNIQFSSSLRASTKIGGVGERKNCSKAFFFWKNYFSSVGIWFDIISSSNDNA